VTAVIFDVDGTLVDHDGAQLRGLTQYLASLGDPLDDARWARWRRLEEFHFARHLAGELSFQEQRRQRVRGFTGEPMDDAAADVWFDGYLQAFEASWRVFDDVAPALEALGDRPLAAFSNVLGGWTRYKLTQVGLAAAFDVVMGTDDVQAAKPDPRTFVGVCAALGVDPPTVWHVGDRYLTDAVGARDAGLRGVWLDRPGADPHGRRPADEPDPSIAVVTSLAHFVTEVANAWIG